MTHRSQAKGQRPTALEQTHTCHARQGTILLTPKNKNLIIIKLHPLCQSGYASCLVSVQAAVIES